MKKTYKTVLSIAGSDSGGGAGIQADIKTISSCGCYAASVVTAVTAQNTVGVRAIHIPPVDFFEAQLMAVLEDFSFDAIKIGMLPTTDYVLVVARMIQQFDLKNIVLDPVMVATSRDRLIDDKAAQAIVRELLPLATVLTPNIPEAEYIAGVDIQCADSFRYAAQKIMDLGAKNVLIKGGHSLSDKVITDILFTESGGIKRFSYDFIQTNNTHGTGCSLSSAIASFLALGFDLYESVQRGDDYLHKALREGADYQIGQGHGPVNHFFL